MGAHETTSSGDVIAPEGRRQDVFAILTLTATVLLTLALVSYDARHPGANLVGPVGHRRQVTAHTDVEVYLKACSVETADRKDGTAGSMNFH